MSTCVTKRPWLKQTFWHINLVCFTKKLIFSGKHSCKFKPFPKQHILDSSKLKEFANNNFKFDDYDRKFSKRIENTVGKREIAHYEQFLLFPQCFQKTCTADHSCLSELLGLYSCKFSTKNFLFWNGKTVFVYFFCPHIDRIGGIVLPFPSVCLFVCLSSENLTCELNIFQ